MNPVIIIKKKRDGQELSQSEIQYFITELTTGKLPQYQMSALLMAIYLNGLTAEETFYLTKSMLESGKVLPASDPLMVDKHSTGGVGDKASFILAPLARACGAKVPMITGRGLGHTGGTVDKAESIPGLKMDISAEHFQKQLKKTGLVICGQSKDIAPADKTIYALRDVTGTVESIPLITASILSKKLSEGIMGLVLDIKVGSGAFCKKKSMARSLAKSLIKTTQKFDRKACAILTDMSQPLGLTIGHSLEIIESVETLKNNGPKDLTDLSVELAAHMLLMAGIEKSLSKAKKKVLEALNSGAALKEFQTWIEEQGGPKGFIENPLSFLEVAPEETNFLAEKPGYIKSLDTAGLGMVCLELGGGRKTAEDVIDPGVGIKMLKKLGDKVKKGEPILTLVHQSSQKSLVAKLLTESVPSCVKIGKQKPVLNPLILEKIGL